MLFRRISAWLLGVAAAAGMVLSAAPAPAAEGAQARFGQMRNFGLIDKCLANHHPTVFVYICDARFDDQFWFDAGGPQIRNWHTDKCLAARPNGVDVFTFDCGPWADQQWRPWAGSSAMFENVHFPGRCLAAHGGGRVFLHECTIGFDDQHWIWPNR
jgi:hypothetical protein